MKFILSIIFLLVSAARIYIINRQTNRELNNPEENPAAPLYLVINLANMILLFFGFWVLTRDFSLILIVYLSASLAFAYLIHVFIGAIAGFNLQDVKRKIRILLLVRNMEVGIQFGLKGKYNIGLLLMFALLVVIFIVSIVGSLWVFWSNPIGSSNARVWIALFQFTLPALSGAMAVAWIYFPSVASEDVDDDFRNFYLSWGFSSFLFLTILLLFPLWIFQSELSSVFGVLPPFWILLSAPILIFFAAYVFPFFLGLYQHRHKSRALLEWRRQWLEKFLQLSQLPDSDARSQAVDERIEELTAERNRLVSESGLFKFYLYVATGNQEGDLIPAMKWKAETETGALMKLLQLAPNPAITSSLLSIMEDDPELGPVMRLEKMKRDVGNETTAPMFDLLWEARKDLPAWDSRFGHAYKVNEIFELVKGTDLTTIGEFIGMRKKDVERELELLTSRKNIIAGTIVTALSGSIVWVFKKFETDIVVLVGNLI